VSENGQAIVDESSVGKMASGGDKKKWEDKQYPLHAKLAQIKRADQIDPAQYSAIFFASADTRADAASGRDAPAAAARQRASLQRYRINNSQEDAHAVHFCHFSPRINFVSCSFFSGGHATCIDFPTAANLKRIAASIYENGGVVGAVCHGPAIFENLRLSTGTNILHGKKATGFSEKGEEAMGAMEWVRQNGQRNSAAALHLS